jgi:predicted GIY-YIG superfamily endonuclease
LHFDRPCKHARHYIGFTSSDSLEQRMERHRSGTGARLLAVAISHGISWVIARTWKFDHFVDARAKEKSLKRQGGASRTCPICKGAAR